MIVLSSIIEYATQHKCGAILDGSHSGCSAGCFLFVCLFFQLQNLQEISIHVSHGYEICATKSSGLFQKGVIGSKKLERSDTPSQQSRYHDCKAGAKLKAGLAEKTGDASNIWFPEQRARHHEPCHPSSAHSRQQPGRPEKPNQPEVAFPKVQNYQSEKQFHPPSHQSAELLTGK